MSRTAPDPRIVAGVAALAVAILLLGEVCVRVFAVGARPDLDDAVLADFATRTATATLVVVVIDTVLMAFLVVFLAAFRRIVVVAAPEAEWVASVVFGAGLVFVGVTLVGDGLEAGGALDTVRLRPDASAIRALTEGHALLFGATGCVLLALVATASGYLVRVTGVLPRWLGWFAYLVAALNLAAIPTVFGGTDPGSFVSSGGSGTALLATFPWIVWVVAAGLLLWRGRTRRAR